MPDFNKTSRPKDIASAIQSLMNFCATDPDIWNLTILRQFLISGLNNVQSATDFMDAPDCSGTLVKKKGEKKGLKKKEATRWCVIKRRVLYYYQKKDYESTPKGIIALDGSIVAMVQLDSGNNNASQSLPKAQPKSNSPRKKAPALKSFKLIQNDRTKYLFTCSDEQECSKWVNEIKRGNSEVQAMSNNVLDGTLEVELIAARELQGSVENGLQNPFCIAYVEGQQTETKQCNGTLNPIWRNSYPPSLEDVEPIPCCRIEDHRSLIWFSVWSKSKKGSAANSFERFQFLGCAIVPVSSLENGVKFDCWIPLAPRKNKEKVSGCLRVALTYSYKKIEADQAIRKAPKMHNLFGVSSLKKLTHAQGNPFPIPAIIAQIVAFFVKHKGSATDCDFFQRPFGDEWSAFLEDFEKSLVNNGKYDLSDDIPPTFVMGLLYFVLKNFHEPLISFAAFNTLFGDQGLQIFDFYIFFDLPI